MFGRPLKKRNKGSNDESVIVMVPTNPGTTDTSPAIATATNPSAPQADDMYTIAGTTNANAIEVDSPMRPTGAVNASTTNPGPPVASATNPSAPQAGATNASAIDVDSPSTKQEVAEYMKYLDDMKFVNEANDRTNKDEKDVDPDEAEAVKRAKKNMKAYQLKVRSPGTLLRYIGTTGFYDKNVRTNGKNFRNASPTTIVSNFVNYFAEDIRGKKYADITKANMLQSVLTVLELEGRYLEEAFKGEVQTHINTYKKEARKKRRANADDAKSQAFTSKDTLHCLNSALAYDKQGHGM
jgi:hypothetical protein